MAASAPTAAQAELISSLSQDDIPIKLRCAICSKLAVNAFRLPCCEQAICENCQATLSSSCPICEHTPVAAEDCKPNKSLRTTIKVFLRTEEKKREVLRLKEAKNTPPVTPPATVDNFTSPSVLEASSAPNVEVKHERPAFSTSLETIATSEQTPFSEELDKDLHVDAQQDIPQPSVEEIAPGQEQIEDETGNNNSGEGGDEVTLGESGLAGNDQNGQPITPSVSQTPGFGMGFGFDATGGGFPQMGMMGQGADFNQMQMLLAMQNGMTTNTFGNFPMMGMPGMTMDPVALQMYMNGGFGAQGMGVSGMNMGMGMAGFDGGLGAGFNNGWNGQQSWNIGQDNFNHPNASGMGLGDFGTNNSGYQAGYNQGNYGRGNQYNDFQQNGYGQSQYPRGRGRGRGYGVQNRGGHGYNQNDVYSQPNQQQFQNGPMQSDSGSIPTGPKASVSASALPKANVDEYGRELREKSEANDSSEFPEQAKTTREATNAPDGENISSKIAVLQEDTQKNNIGKEQDDTPKPSQELSQEGNAHYNGNNQNYASMQPPDIPVAAKVPDVPLNAPTGPKAMREGLPNTSIVHLRARGLSVPEQNGYKQHNSNVAASETIRSRNGTPDRERSKDRSQTRSPRSASPDRKQKKRHRHRSTSISEDGKEEERRRERRRRHSRRYENESENNPKDAIIDERDVKHKANGTESNRSRSQSPTESRRSSHRSRKDREYDRDKERNRERDKDHKSSSQRHRSSHRSHRDRSRENRHRRRHEEDADEVARKKETDIDIDIDIDMAPPSASFEKPPVMIPSGPRSMTVATAFPTAPINSDENASGIEINIRGASRRMSVQTESEPTSATNFRPEERKDRDRELDRDRERDRERHRDRDRDRDRERSSRHREERARHSSRNERHSHSQSQSPFRSDIKIPTGPAGAKKHVAVSAVATDPHTLEREKRNRDRLMKEAQRMAGLNALISGTAGRKRSLDTGDESGSRRRSRKIRTKGDKWEDDEGGEARLARLESEREAGRWG